MLKLIATAGLATVLAAPAFAQQGTSSTQSPGQPGQAQMQHMQQGQAGSQRATVTPDELRQELSQAGFQDVRILDSAYLVSAKTKQGHDVVMMINPPDMTSGHMASGMNGSGNSATGSSSQMPSSMSGGSSSGSGTSGQHR